MTIKPLYIFDLSYLLFDSQFFCYLSVFLYLNETFGLPWWLKRVKRLPVIWETRVRFLGGEDPLEKEIATHSSTLAWKIPWTEKHGRLQSMGSQKVRHD